MLRQSNVQMCELLQVRSFAKEQASTGRYGGAQDQVVGWGLQSARASGFFFGFNSLVGTGSIVFVRWYGARQVGFTPLLRFHMLSGLPSNPLILRA